MSSRLNFKTHDPSEEDMLNTCEKCGQEIPEEKLTLIRSYTGEQWGDSLSINQLESMRKTAIECSIADDPTQYLANMMELVTPEGSEFYVNGIRQI